MKADMARNGFRRSRRTQRAEVHGGRELSKDASCFSTAVLKRKWRLRGCGRLLSKQARTGTACLKTDVDDDGKAIERR